MTGVEVAAGLAALGSTAGTGAAAAGTGAALGAGAAGAAGTGAALGAGAAGAAGAGAALGAGAGTAAGLTAAEAAALGIAPETMGLLNAGGYLAPEMGAALGTEAGAAEAGLLSAEQFAAYDAAAQSGVGSQQAMQLAAQNEGLLGATEATNAAADPALTQGMQQPWYQQASNWLSEKPMGEGKLSPSRGQMIQKGASAATPQQQQSAPPARQPGGQYQPVAQSSPYMNGTQTPEQFLAMADFLRRRY